MSPPSPVFADSLADHPLNTASIWKPVWHEGRMVDAVLTTVGDEFLTEQGRPRPGWVHGGRLTDLLPGAVVDGRLALLSRTAETGVPFVITQPRTGGHEAVHLTGERLGDGRLLVQSRSVESQDSRDRQRSAAENRWRRLIEDAPLGIIVTNFHGILLEVNRTMCTLLERSPDELIGHPVNEFTHPDDPTRLDRSSALQAGRASMDKRYLTKSGTTVCLRISASVVVEEGEPLLISTCEDITAEVNANAALQRQATVDDVTGLWNRPATRQILERCLDDIADGTATVVSVLLVNLDRFKVVNTSLGPAVGDALLANVANRLRDVIPAGASMGRTGGDEFVVIAPGVDDPTTLALRLQEALQAPVLAGHRHVTIGASIGIVIADDCDREDEQRAVALLRDADTALQVAKRAGTGHVVTFDDSLRNQAMSRLDTEQDLRMALADDQLVLHFQPITSLAAGASPYSEALVRWHHPGKGILQPGQFLPVAEESGLMVPLGRRILALACRQLAIWRRSEPSTRLAVNVAAEHLAAGTLVDDVLNVLRRHDLPASALTIEVTEQTLLAGQGSAAADLARLRAAGARIAIDDFGTGYSSLAYLRDLPVDVLKIDRTFVAGLGTEANDGALFAAIIAISQSLGLDTVAEGIETHSELDAAVRAGATYLQGFLLGRPRPPERLIV